MPRLTPLSRREVIRKLRAAGWTGPEPGGRHRTMHKGSRSVLVPNPHGRDVSIGLMRKIIRDSGLTVEEWLDLQS
ncbi:MAG: type II toxin-antitoxin system HicA family toxin [Armatimonadetes bacterium]|nr:type II toxin-antitoxin system HicA family toxin [Armatimonadota bacterium]NCO90656.1 type II toxin-antitoxin system HicA family toxin [Armatimonadota bacterium]NCP30549.1 type II toxin-antitoxin system HicA family toxin [Armatimonadota bacterium]NCQ29426.1 type II toxin-antitoxin system HicA family toxin [Armatimonadota bacterium]NDK13055.1 type II toxin-antitoxin system HicA family toxin [Armatimonadota bacterium]